MKHELIQLDLCTPDYFNGCSYPYMVILVFKDTTKEELIDEIVGEYSATYEHLVGTPGSPWPDLSSDEIKELANDAVLTDTPFSNSEYLPTSDDAPEEYDVYLHIGIREV